MKKSFLILTLLSVVCLSFAQDRNLKLVQDPVENPTNQKRKAVVIGMSDYGEGRSLSNTLQDADDMASVLTVLGFEVTLLKNNDFRSLEENLSAWYRTIENHDMAIFYFAGHGMEANGENYLVPVDARLNSETDVKYNTLNVNQVIGNMDEKRVRFKLLILDACRDNPFTRGWSRSNAQKGLAQMSAPKGTLIAFAAQPGATAADGGTYDLQNGVFTHFLKQEIVREGASIDVVLNRVASAVSEITNDRQLPYKTGILTDEFYFVPSGHVVAVPPPVVTNTPKTNAEPPPANTSKTNEMSSVKIKPINKQIELRLESCIRDGKSVTISYSLKNNTGRNYRMLYIGSSTAWCPANNGEYTTVVDDMGNNYTAEIKDQKYNTYHELAGNKPDSNRSLSVTLPTGVWVKGKYTILNVNPEAKSFQVVNIAFDQYGGGNLCYDVSYGFTDLPISD